ncbi:MAG: tetraacyldisaccharide 4'-kinase [Candidatus Omnitrophota bacterium]
MSSVREYLYNLVTGKISGPVAVFLRACLWVLSLVYGLGVTILANFYRAKAKRFKAKVISVGNITLGGTGKTTLVEYLSSKITSAGHKVAVLSRGYKRDTRRLGTQSLGDEPTMLVKNLPLVKVVVNKNRIKGAQTAIDGYAADTLIIDDGLQQWKIAKDLEIVTIDAANPFGNGRLLPAGFLREPLSALKRADVFVLTQVRPEQDIVELYARLRGINSRALIVESIHKMDGFNSLSTPNETLDLNSFKSKIAVVFSGIGNPEGFEKNIQDLGIHVAKSFRFIDHHDYLQADIDKIIKMARLMQADTIITTQKDAVKIRELEIKGAQIVWLNIKLSITHNETEFNRRLLKLYSL